MIRPPVHRACLGAAFLLPLIVFAYMWATTHWMAQQGQEWLIPIKGYDPRDLLRGHFIQYQYDWPTGETASVRPADAASAFDPTYARELCIEGVAPHIARVREAGSGKGCSIIVRATLGTRAEVRGLESGILYTSQSRVAVLSRQLADPKLQGLLRVKIRPDGVMRPVDLEFRPRAAR